MKTILTLLVLLALFTLTNCRATKLSPEEREEKKQLLIEEKDLSLLQAESKKQHFRNQDKETRKMMQKSKKYSRNLKQPKRKKCF
jgi:uncharacterized protein YcfL